MSSRALRLIAAALLGLSACVASRSARADFAFNPLGTGAGGAVVTSTLDPAPGNALSVGGVTAINNFVAGNPNLTSRDFQLYYQANLQGISGPGGTIPLPGLNSTYQVTVIGSITERVTGVIGTEAQFSVSPVQNNSFLRIYDTQPPGGVSYDNLAGTGFTDGNLILSATPIISANGSGSFRNVVGAPVTFDQFGANNYGITTTVVGNGVSTIDFSVNSALAGYFPNGVPSIIGLEFITSSSTPFNAVNPSARFTTLVGGVPTLFSPSIGAINGTSGPDFQFQADAFVTPVPEPTSVCLMGLGVIGVLAYSRKRLGRDA